MKHFNEKALLAMTVEDFFRQASGARKEDQPIGTTTIEHLPELTFTAFVNFQNAKVEMFLRKIPMKNHAFRDRVKDLRFPTWRDFRSLLDDPEKRKTIPPELRKMNDFYAYRSWALLQLRSTVFRDFVKKPFEYYLPFRFRQKHHLLISESGGGKSENQKALLLMDKMPREDERAPVSSRLAVVLIEPAGDVSEEIAQQKVFYEDFKFRQKNGRDPNLIYVDPLLAHAEGKYFVFNPFDVSGKNHSDIQLGKLAQQLSSSIVAMLGSGNELSLQMDTVLHPCLFLLLTLPDSTFHNLLGLMNDDSELVELGKQSSNLVHRRFFRERFLASSYKRTKASVATKILSLLNHEAFTKMCCSPRSSFDLEQAVQEGKTIIIPLSKGKLGKEVSAAIGKLLVANLLAIALNRAESKKYRTPISLILDESHNFTSQSIEEVLSEARKYRLSLTLCSQVLGFQMDSQLTKLVLGNTCVKGIGKAGHHSRQIMAREMGVSPESFNHLRVGEFVYKCESNPPIRIQFTDKFIGDKTLMTDGQWEELKQFMIDRYYVSPSATAPNSGTIDSQLAEEISGSKIGVGFPEHTSPIEIDHFDLEDEE